MIILPPGNSYPSSGTCKTSLTNTRRTSLTLILDPLLARIDIILPARVRLNALLVPSKFLAGLSNN